MRTTLALTCVIALGLAGVEPAAAQTSLDDFHVEFTATYWPLSPTGNVQTLTTMVDLGSDLGVENRKGHPQFGLVVKPGRKHRILFETIPYRLKGSNTIDRTFEFGGRVFQVQDQIESETRINYLFGGYQYDIVSRQQGHAGVRAGIAYFDAKASATSLQFGSGTEEAKVPLPMIGGEFRAFPIPDNDIFNVNGEVKGMSLGPYGHYVHANFNGGFRVFRYVRLQAGFSIVDMDVHEKNRSQGFKLRFTGPVFSVQIHD
jgi:hypothetical protein